ncbi:hypothetical protein OLCHANIL_00260 [Vibrio phage V05]|nr:hypothetical protein OLCHANIL_00260 [Vibrio phage V05]
MQEDYDPHLQVCLLGGLLTEKQIAAHKAKQEDHSDTRHIGKGGNYACQYGAGIETLMRQLGIPLEVAKAVHSGYWKLNWSIKKIAQSTTVKHANGEMWQYNPVSGLWYWLKADKDRFSTLCQGLGAYIFDKWCEATGNIVRERYGATMPFVAQFHDELILMVKEGTLGVWHDILKGCRLRCKSRRKPPATTTTPPFSLCGWVSTTKLSIIFLKLPKKCFLFSMIFLSFNLFCPKAL